jgi:hypothetical protein
MHPSPLSVPERYGGKGKLSVIYELQHEDVERFVRDTFTALKQVFHHIHGEAAPLPSWISDLGSLVDGGGLRRRLNGRALGMHHYLGGSDL